MLKVNEYFEGKVKSIAVDKKKEKETSGGIDAGEFEFGKSTIEYMTVTYGEMLVMLPGSEEWKLFTQNETFRVDKDTSFKVKVTEPVSYLCRYE